MSPLSTEELIEARALSEQVLDGFNRHYARFRECARAAKVSFEKGDWANIQKLVADRVAYYDERVAETIHTWHPINKSALTTKPFGTK